MGGSVKRQPLPGDWWFPVFLEEVVQLLDEEVLPGALEFDGEHAELPVRFLVDVGGDWGSVAPAPRSPR